MARPMRGRIGSSSSAASGTRTRTLTLTLADPVPSPSSTSSSSSSSQPRQEQTLVLRLRPPSKKVTWKEGTVDNEFLQRKSSKKCCIFHKQKSFDEDDSDEEDIGHGHGHGLCIPADSFYAVVINYTFFTIEFLGTLDLHGDVIVRLPYRISFKEQVLLEVDSVHIYTE
ncbi:hypothetical protein MKW98_011691 [Papaver atlanticum]|uniref:Protein phosphatase 1 regulatory subunit 11 n=1 Tax=Papaver atlanticum TaxID=357466 RepID=A0AAD4XAM3_9MAGN|nr:hypothetical protein MKW98_011691 [Papaver atlanticum]